MLVQTGFGEMLLKIYASLAIAARQVLIIAVLLALEDQKIIVILVIQEHSFICHGV